MSAGGNYGFCKTLTIASRGQITVKNRGFWKAYVNGAAAKHTGKGSCPYDQFSYLGKFYYNMWHNGWNASKEELNTNGVIPGMKSLTHKQAARLAKSIMHKAEKGRKQSNRRNRNNV